MADEKVTMTPEQTKIFNESVKAIGRICIATMNILDIPNFISATFEQDGKKYYLRFEKEDGGIESIKNKLTKELHSV